MIMMIMMMIDVAARFKYVYGYTLGSALFPTGRASGKVPVATTGWVLRLVCLSSGLLVVPAAGARGITAQAAGLQAAAPRERSR